MPYAVCDDNNRDSFVSFSKPASVNEICRRVIIGPEKIRVKGLRPFAKPDARFRYVARRLNEIDLNAQGVFKYHGLAGSNGEANAPQIKPKSKRLI
jgi:hypothetical protein